MKKANDSAGCRELQQMLRYGTYQEQEEILRQLRGHVAEATAQAQLTVADEWRMQYKGSGYLKSGGNWNRRMVHIKGLYTCMYVYIYIYLYAYVYLYLSLSLSLFI